MAREGPQANVCGETDWFLPAERNGCVRFVTALLDDDDQTKRSGSYSKVARVIVAG
jgi:hypothetical protein